MHARSSLCREVGHLAGDKNSTRISRGYIPGRGAGGLAQVYGEGSEEGLEGKGDGDVEGVCASA